MGLTDIADQITRVIDDTGTGAKELFEPVLRVGVTGLSRAGKTVFITSLIANMLDRIRMPALGPRAGGQIINAFLQPQPDETIPRFAYEAHLQALQAPAPFWPESTSSISQLRLSLRSKRGGVLGGLRGQRTLHIDIIDYPGEWLLDLPLLRLSYAAWSAQELEKAQARQTLSHDWLEKAKGVDAGAKLDEPQALMLAEAYTDYLHAARGAGFSNCAPGRFLLPGDLKGSPVLTFAPLPRPEKPRRDGLYRAFEHRFNAYKKQVIKPFYRNHFSKIDRQIVLVDALGAIDNGPPAVEDLRQALSAILTSFRPGKNHILSRLTGKKVEKILFAASKADHIHHSQHPHLTGFLQALLREAKDAASWKGADTHALSLAALRATVEQNVKHEGATLELVRGTLQDGREVALHPGDLPENPERLLAPAREGAADWPEGISYDLPEFAPPKPGEKAPHGLAHIRMDQAAAFLLGDRL